MLRQALLSLACQSLRSRTSAVSNDAPSSLKQIISARVSSATTGSETCREAGRWRGSNSRFRMAADGRVAGARKTWALAIGEILGVELATDFQRRVGASAPPGSIPGSSLGLEPHEEDAEGIVVVLDDGPEQKV